MKNCHQHKGDCKKRVQGALILLHRVFSRQVRYDYGHVVVQPPDGVVEEAGPHPGPCRGVHDGQGGRLGLGGHPGVVHQEQGLDQGGIAEQEQGREDAAVAGVANDDYYQSWDSIGAVV